MNRALIPAATAVLGTLLWGCNPHVRVDPIKVEPIEATVNVNVRLDKRLDQFFAFEDTIGSQDAAKTPGGEGGERGGPGVEKSTEVP